MDGPSTRDMTPGSFAFIANSGTRHFASPGIGDPAAGCFMQRR